ncbi:hypothetical protein [Bdellovibrio sp. HCB337]|uniref:hypothetical protein n=1 Tax=Bdellovibrio sp. HCB337 TaxID=3394358 RepID=UPI0039A5947A
MPTIKEYQSKKKKTRRRPGREEEHHEESETTEADVPTDGPEDIEVEVISAEEAVSVDASEDVAFTQEASPSEEDTYGQHNPNQDERKKIHIEFPYSELVRSRVPKAFEVAENVAEEWVNNGTFENIPVGHPLAQITVAAGLRKAKEVEKKLEEKGVFMMAKMGLEYAKSKINRK